MEKAPIVIEHRKRIITEEVQPILYREVVEPEIIKETRNIYEKYVEAPILIEETREAKFIDAKFDTKFVETKVIERDTKFVERGTFPVDSILGVKRV
jgi:hypothetical protein